jgi:hypothetical protein
MMESMTDSPPQVTGTPREEYTQRLETWKSHQAHYETQHRRIGIAQLGLGALTLVLIGLALAAKVVSIYVAAAPVLAIVVLAVVHDRVLKSRERSSRTVEYYKRALARIDNSWMGTGETGERFLSDSHPYSRDLDLFGAGSLFELLCIARTQVGQQTLANWLLAPAAPGDVLARHEAVTDLRSRLDLRQDLAVLAEDARSLASAGDLAAWGDGEPQLASAFLRFSSALLAGLWLASVLGWMVWGVAYPALLMSMVNVSFTLAYRRSQSRASRFERRGKCGPRPWPLGRRAGPAGTRTIQRAPVGKAAWRSRFPRAATFALDCPPQSLDGIPGFET